MTKLLLLALAVASLVVAQDNSGADRTIPFTMRSDMPGTCKLGQVITRKDLSPGSNVFICGATNNWVVLGGGSGSGTVTSVSAPSSLFSVSNPTTTPALAYATGQTANLILGSDGSGNIGLMNLTSSQLPRSIASGVNTVAFSATPAFDLSLGNTQKITLTGNVTASSASNIVAGENTTIIICQDGTGGRTFSWPASVRGGMAIGGVASTCSAQMFSSDGINLFAVTPGVINQ